MSRLRFMGELPRSICMAVSGGADSMAIMDFLIKGGRDVHALHFNHGTEHGLEAEAFIRNYCGERSIELSVGNISSFRDKTSKESSEEYWRNARYDFFENASNNTVITGHHLDDQVESWIFTSFHGKGRLIPYRRGNYLRPFLLTKAENMVSWCKRKMVPYVKDPSNLSDKYMRSYIRNNIVEKALFVNPGIYKTISKMVLREFNENKGGGL